MSKRFFDTLENLPAETAGRFLYQVLSGVFWAAKNSDRIGKGVVLATDVANHQDIYHQGAQKAYEHIHHSIPHAGAVDVLQVSSDDGGR